MQESVHEQLAVLCAQQAERIPRSLYWWPTVYDHCFAPTASRTVLGFTLAVRVRRRLWGTVFLCVLHARTVDARIVGARTVDVRTVDAHTQHASRPPALLLSALPDWDRWDRQRYTELYVCR
jgi:hypothetical protein